MKQTKITVSGAQIWKKQILATASGRFAFASTLAVHVYDQETFQLLKLLNFADTNITAIQWEPVTESLLAQATIDKRLVIWDIEPETVKFEVQFVSHITQIEWNPNLTTQIFCLQSSGDTQIIDLGKKKVENINIVISAKSKPTVVRCHPKRPDIVAYGLENGHIYFLNLRSKETYIFDACDTAARKRSKLEENPLFTVSEIALLSEQELMRNVPLDSQEVRILEMRWDPNEDNLLVSFGDKSMALITFQGLDEQTFIAKKFERQQNQYENLVWLNDRSGDFLTASSKVGIVQLWNVAQAEPKQTFKIGSRGVHNMTMINQKKGQSDGHRILIALKNGGTLVYNISRQSVEFKTEAGHSETIFDVEYCRSNQKYLASCSYDGTVRVWNSNSMKLETVCDTSISGPQAKSQKRIIYSISWHPQDQKLALCTINGNCIVYDAPKAKLLSSITPHQGEACFKVAWNQLNPEFILLSCSQIGICLIRVDDPEQCKQLTLQREFNHPSPVFGVCWSPKNENIFITGCKDAKVRLFDIRIGTGNPVKVLQGHTDKVYNVLYNPLLPSIAISGSDDQSIRVWDTESDDFQATAVCGGVGVKNSHSSNVRALAFVPEISYALMSGSWDSTIKMWDIRSGQCMLTLTDHNSDVYGISFHPARPFVFSSCSRDTSIRMFCIEGMVQSLKMNFLCKSGPNQDSWDKLVDKPENAYAQKGTYKLCGQNAHQLVDSALKGGFDSELEQLLRFYDFLTFTEGQDELFSVLRFINGKPVTDKAELASLSENSVVHTALLADTTRARARQLQNATGMQMVNTQFARKEDRLLEAAKCHLRVGNFKEYCEIHFELGNYKKAMAFAPSVSIEYWQELAQRHTAILEEKQSLEAPLAAIVSNQCDKAIDLFVANEEYEDAKVVKALQMCGLMTNVLDKIKLKEGCELQPALDTQAQQQFRSYDFRQIDPKTGRKLRLIQIVEKESETLFFQGKTLQAAAAYLSINDCKAAIQVLVRTQELYLAYYIAKYFYQPALKEVALRLAERAERYFQTDICLALLQNDVQDKDIEQSFINRLTRSGLIKRDQNWKEIDETNAKEAMEGFKSGKYPDESIGLLIRSNKLAEACDCALEVLTDLYMNPPSDVNQMKMFFKILDQLQRADISRVKSPSKVHILFYSAYAGLYHAVWNGFYEILLVIIQQVNELSQGIDGSVPFFTQTIIDQITRAAEKMQASKDQGQIPLTSVKLKFADTESTNRYTAFFNAHAAYMKEKSHLFGEPGIYLNMASGSCIQGKALSAFTKTTIKGQVCQLEDGKTYVSQEEAVEWALCNRFSFLNSGYRSNPF